jgi:DNA ligase-1
MEMPTTRKLAASSLMGCCLLLPLSGMTGDQPSPPVMLANAYHAAADIELADYWGSEKFDGVHAYWDGSRLLTRAGNAIRAPAWFTAHWPRVALDGELWAGRGRFEHASATVRRESPDDAAWRQMCFMVFDLPARAGSFVQRLAELDSLRHEISSPWMQVVTHFQVRDHETLQARLRGLVAQGGEGLMLRRGGAPYRSDRSDDLLKHKLHEDDEARVIAHLPGNGKYQGMMGAVLVQRADGVRFRIGTGFTDEQRADPPPLGSWVTYAYNGLTSSGIPRFARFIRIRAERY